MKLSPFTLSVLLLIVILLGTAGLFVRIMWTAPGWPFWGGIGLGAIISGVALYSVPDFWRLLKKDLRQ